MNFLHFGHPNGKVSFFVISKPKLLDHRISTNHFRLYRCAQVLSSVHGHSRSAMVSLVSTVSFSPKDKRHTTLDPNQQTVKPEYEDRNFEW